MSIVEDADFQHILRVLNTNVDGREKVPYALCKIRGIGRRFANLICKKVIDAASRGVWRFCYVRCDLVELLQWSAIHN